VACTRANQGTGDAASASAATARGLLELAIRRLTAATPALVLIGGLPGTGKSTVARGIVDAAPDRVLARSDVVRKELAGLPPNASAAADIGTGLYEPSMIDRVYASMADRARAALEHGTTVVVDASFQRAEHRERFRSVALATRSRVVELRCEVAPEVAATRIRRRLAEATDASDATPAVAASMAASFDAWPEAVSIATGGDIDSVVDTARRAVDDRRREMRS
jgi:predicted kinase